MLKYLEKDKIITVEQCEKYLEKKEIKKKKKAKRKISRKKEIKRRTINEE